MDAAITEVDCNVHWREKLPSKLSSIYTNFNKHADSESWRVSVPRGIPPELSGKEIFVGTKFQDSLPGILSRIKKYVISQSEIVGRMAGMLLLSSMLEGGDLDDYRPFDIESISIPFDPDCISESEFRYFITVWQKAPYRFLKMRHEGFYDRREAEEFLGTFHDFHVYVSLSGGIIRRYLDREPDPVYTAELEVQSRKLYEWVKRTNHAYRMGLPLEPFPDEVASILSDDEIILNHVKDTLRHKDYYVVTGDVELARQIAIGRVYHGGSNMRTFRIPTREWIMAGTRADKLFRTNGGLKSLVAEGPDCNVWTDTGSFDTWWEKIRAEFLGASHDGSDKKYKSYTVPHKECIMQAEREYLKLPASERKFMTRPETFDTLHYGSDPSRYWNQMKLAAIKSCKCGLYEKGVLTKSRSRMIFKSTSIVPLLPAEEWKPTEVMKVELSVHDVAKTLPRIGASALIRVTAEDVASVVRPRPIREHVRSISDWSSSQNVGLDVALGSASFVPS